MREKSKEENVNYDYCEIETKNVELENIVAKLLSENEHLCKEINHVKQVFKDQFDSIKKTLKGKEIVDIAAQIPSANTIVPGMFKLDLEHLAPRLKCSTSNCGSKPTDNKKNDRISQTPSRNMKIKVEAQPRKVNKKNRVVEPIHDVDVKHSLLNANFELIYATCKKSMFDEPNNAWGSNATNIPSSSSLFMTSCPDRSLVSGLRIFGNDQIARIIGYGDYQLGNVTISRVYDVEGLGHNLFSIGQFCNADLKVAFRKNTYFVRNLEGVDLL
ncbi:hypothetical protein Tco_1363255 [Tanacetum coccineum]